MTNPIQNNSKLHQDAWPWKNTDKSPCFPDLSSIDLNQTTLSTIANDTYIPTEQCVITTPGTDRSRSPFYTLLTFLGWIGIGGLKTQKSLSQYATWSWNNLKEISTGNHDISQEIRIYTEASSEESIKTTQAEWKKAHIFVDGERKTSDAASHLLKNGESLGDFHDWIKTHCNKDSLGLSPKATNEEWHFHLLSGEGRHVSVMEIEWTAFTPLPLPPYSEMEMHEIPLLDGEVKNQNIRLKIKLVKSKSIEIQKAEIFDLSTDPSKMKVYINDWKSPQHPTRDLKSWGSLVYHRNYLEKQYKKIYESLPQEGKDKLPKPIKKNLIGATAKKLKSQCFDLEFAIMQANDHPEGYRTYLQERLTELNGVLDEAPKWISKEITPGNIADRKLELEVEQQKLTKSLNEETFREKLFGKTPSWEDLSLKRQIETIKQQRHFLENFGKITSREGLEGLHNLQIECLYKIELEANAHLRKFCKDRDYRPFSIDDLFENNGIWTRAQRALEDRGFDRTHLAHRGSLPLEVIRELIHQGETEALIAVFSQMSNEAAIIKFNEQIKTYGELITREKLGILSTKESLELRRIRALFSIEIDRLVDVHGTGWFSNQHTEQQFIDFVNERDRTLLITENEKYFLIKKSGENLSFLDPKKGMNFVRMNNDNLKTFFRHMHEEGDNISIKTLTPKDTLITELNDFEKRPIQTDLQRMEQFDKERPCTIQIGEQEIPVRRATLYSMGAEIEKRTELPGASSREEPIYASVRKNIASFDRLDRISSKDLLFEQRSVLATMAVADSPTQKEVKKILSMSEEIRYSGETSFKNEITKIRKSWDSTTEKISGKWSDFKIGMKSARALGWIGMGRGLFTSAQAAATGDQKNCFLGLSDLTISTLVSPKVVRLLETSDIALAARGAPLAGSLMSSVVGTFYLSMFIDRLSQDKNNPILYRDDIVNIGFTGVGISADIGLSGAEVLGVSTGPAGIVVTGVIVVGQMVYGGVTAIIDAKNDIHVISTSEGFERFFQGMFGIPPTGSVRKALEQKGFWNEIANAVLKKLKENPNLKRMGFALPEVKAQTFKAWDFPCDEQTKKAAWALAASGSSYAGSMSFCFKKQKVTKTKYVPTYENLEIDLSGNRTNKKVDRSYPEVSTSTVQPICLPHPIDSSPSVNNPVVSKKTYCENAAVFEKKSSEQASQDLFELGRGKIKVTTQVNDQTNLFLFGSGEVDIASNGARGDYFHSSQIPIKGVVRSKSDQGVLILPQISQDSLGIINATHASYGETIDLQHEGVTKFIATPGGETITLNGNNPYLDPKGGRDTINGKEAFNATVKIYPSSSYYSGKGNNIHLVHGEEGGEAWVYLDKENKNGTEIISLNIPMNDILSICIQCEGEVFEKSPLQAELSIDIRTPKGSFKVNFDQNRISDKFTTELPLIIQAPSPLKSKGRLLLRRILTQDPGRYVCVGFLQAEIKEQREAALWETKSSFPCIKSLDLGKECRISLEDYPGMYPLSKEIQEKYDKIQIQVNNKNDTVSVIAIPEIFTPLEIGGFLPETNVLELLLPQNLTTTLVMNREGDGLVLTEKNSNNTLTCLKYFHPQNPMHFVNEHGQKLILKQSQNSNSTYELQTDKKSRVYEIDTTKCGWFKVTNHEYPHFDVLKIRGLSSESFILYRRNNEAIITSTSNLPGKLIIELQDFYSQSIQKIFQFDDREIDFGSLRTHVTQPLNKLQQWFQGNLGVDTYKLKEGDGRCHVADPLSKDPSCLSRKTILEIEESPCDLKIDLDQKAKAWTFQSRENPENLICFKDLDSHPIQEIHFPQINQTLPVHFPPTLEGTSRLEKKVRCIDVEHAIIAFPQVLSIKDEGILQSFLRNPNKSQWLPEKISIQKIARAIAHLASRRILEGREIASFFVKANTSSEQTIRNKVQNAKADLLHLKTNCKSQSLTPPKCPDTIYDEPMLEQLVSDLSPAWKTFLTNTILWGNNHRRKRRAITSEKLGSLLSLRQRRLLSVIDKVQPMTSGAAARLKVGFPLSLLSKIPKFIPDLKVLEWFLQTLPSMVEIKRIRLNIIDDPAFSTELKCSLAWDRLAEKPWLASCKKQGEQTTFLPLGSSLALVLNDLMERTKEASFLLFNQGNPLTTGWTNIKTEGNKMSWQLEKQMCQDKRCITLYASCKTEETKMPLRRGFPSIPVVCNAKVSEEKSQTEDSAHISWKDEIPLNQVHPNQLHEISHWADTAAMTYCVWKGLEDSFIWLSGLSKEVILRPTIYAWKSRVTEFQELKRLWNEVYDICKKQVDQIFEDQPIDHLFSLIKAAPETFLQDKLELLESTDQEKQKLWDYMERLAGLKMELNDFEEQVAVFSYSIEKEKITGNDHRLLKKEIEESKEIFIDWRDDLNIIKQNQNLYVYEENEGEENLPTPEIQEIPTYALRFLPQPT